MSGTIEGGKLAAATTKQRYGDNHYRTIGKLGGQISRGGGVTGDPERARIIGRIGGKVSKGRKAIDTTAPLE